ncbi:MAG: hypothetical protein ACNYPF_04855 [Candidatus Puniceispirillales bacterium WSBS_2018_MAG_OTU23]
MSTIGYESWAVDLANVGAVYPFQGWEVVMTVLGVAFWLRWHWKQFSMESRELKEAVMAYKSEDAIKAVERY